MHHHVIYEVAKEIKKEIKKLCSDKNDSILRMKTKLALERFSWDCVLTELQLTTPTLLKILTDCLPKKKTATSAVIRGICTAASIMLKLSDQKINLVQGVLSVVLRAGSASKQVYTATLQQYMHCT